jgi:glycosyltransferase involved in cell wall biosynthesis
MGIERSKLHVVPNGIDHRLYFPRPAEAVEAFMVEHGQAAPYFFYVGRLEHPGKNHCRLIEAYEAFRDESGLEIDLVLAGADWSGAEVVHERIDASPCVDDIRRLGFVDDDDLPFWYCGARAVLLPSLSEGFGIPIAEAFACGVPVVASHLPPLKEVGADEAEYVDPLDAASIRDGLTRISRGGGEGGGARRERARGFDWDEVAEQIRRIYGLGELEMS